MRECKLPPLSCVVGSCNNCLLLVPAAARTGSGLVSYGPVGRAGLHAPCAAHACTPVSLGTTSIHVIIDTSRYLTLVTVSVTTSTRRSRSVLLSLGVSNDRSYGSSVLFPVKKQRFSLTINQPTVLFSKAIRGSSVPRQSSSLVVPPLLLACFAPSTFVLAFGFGSPTLVLAVADLTYSTCYVAFKSS
jgi:hypothetical protein